MVSRTGGRGGGGHQKWDKVPLFPLFFIAPLSLVLCLVGKMRVWWIRPGGGGWSLGEDHPGMVSHTVRTLSNQGEIERVGGHPLSLSA